jgi:hypothetical protein
MDLASEDETNPFRGNKYQSLYKNQNGEAEIDSIGQVKMRDVTDSESRSRRNYQRGNVINYLDGDSLSQSSYGYGSQRLLVIIQGSIKEVAGTIVLIG